jgi:hypothetical protein
MIEVIYKASCDNPAHNEPEFIAEYSRKNEIVLRGFIKRIQALGWRRVEDGWACPSCVRSLSASVRKEVKGKR